MRPRTVLLGCVGSLLAPAVGIAQIGISAKTLIAIDKLVAQKAKVVFVSKDPGVTKSTNGLDDTAAVLQVSYTGVGGATSGQFLAPMGALDGNASGWKVNKDTVAKYVNRDDPEGGIPTGVKVAVIKPGKLLKLVGRTLGDTPLDLIGAGAPTGPVRTVFLVGNLSIALDTHCSIFPTCTFKEIAGGDGRKLVCKNGIPDPSCNGSGPGPCVDSTHPTCGGTCPGGSTCIAVTFQSDTLTEAFCRCAPEGQSCANSGECSVVTTTNCELDVTSACSSQVGECSSGKTCTFAFVDGVCIDGDNGAGTFDATGCMSVP